MKIATWNVNGVRAREEQLLAFLAAEKPDVVCLQEIKIEASQLTLGLGALSEYTSHWHGGGAYSGVSLHFRKETFADAPSFACPAFDREHRVVAAVMSGIRFLSVYVPNGGKDYAAKLAFLRDMAAYVKDAHEKGESLVLAGDLNVARTDADVHPKEQKPNAIGQREDERALFEDVLAAGLVDVQRALHPDDDRTFTWWPYWRTARQRNIGWRIDYVLASAPVASRARTAVSMRDTGTSDHAPLVVVLD